MKPGRYVARALSASLGKNGKGNPRIAVQFQVQEGEAKGHTIVWYGNLDEKGKEFSLPALKNCGWDGKNIAVFVAKDGAGVKPPGFGDVDVSIVVELFTKRDGSTEPSVKWVNPIGGSSLFDKAAMTEAEALELAASLGQSTVVDPAAKPKADVPF